MFIKCQLALLNALPYDTPSLRIHIDPRARLSRSYWSVRPCLDLYSCIVPTHLTVAPFNMSLMMKIQRSRPGQHSPAQGSCSRPACRSAIPRQSASVCLGCPILPGVAGSTHLPLCESQLHVSPALGGESLVVLQASAHDAAGDGEVAVVAAQSEETPRQSPRVARAIGGCKSGRRVNWDSPEACGFPRERHLG